MKLLWTKMNRRGEITNVQKDVPEKGVWVASITLPHTGLQVTLHYWALDGVIMLPTMCHNGYERNNFYKKCQKEAMLLHKSDFERTNVIRATKVSFPDNQYTTNMLYELGSFLDPGENMIITYENGKYYVEFEHEEVFDDFSMPADLLKLLTCVW